METTSDSWTGETRAAFLEALDRYPASAGYLASHDIATYSSSCNDAKQVVHVSTALAHARVIQTAINRATGISPSLQLIWQSVEPQKGDAAALKVPQHHHATKRPSPLSSLPHTASDSEVPSSLDIAISETYALPYTSDAHPSAFETLPPNFSPYLQPDDSMDTQSMSFSALSSPGLSLLGSMSLSSPNTSPPSMSRRRLASNIPALRCQVNLPPPNPSKLSLSVDTLRSPNTLDSPSPLPRHLSILRKVQPEDMVTPVDQMMHTPFEPPALKSHSASPLTLTERPGGGRRWCFGDYSNLPSPSTDYPMHSPLHSSCDSLLSPVQETTPIWPRPCLRNHAPGRPALSLSRRLSYSQAVLNTPDRASPRSGPSSLTSSGLASPLVIRTPGLTAVDIASAESPMVLPSGLRTYFD
ncbi:hypothetical protein OE88DRAFT_1811958 [Heliocybe sulcata]|uniref:Uncharacterized protein n=1 Tax=Heliocybe sulcata TaxID=5364 RepID=A0A5C3MNG7_9AGAM|nr:hypothetical protein OE88DRAFT_1811958 [Heliocybe sulcata]